MSCSRVL